MVLDTTLLYHITSYYVPFYKGYLHASTITAYIIYFFVQILNYTKVTSTTTAYVPVIHILGRKEERKQI